MKKCPFCKEENPTDASSCRYCGRILIERTGSIFESEYSTPKKKTPSVKARNQHYAVALVLSVLRKFKRVIGFFVVIGIITRISSITGNTYQQDIQSAITTISTHVKSISQYQGEKTNSIGEKYDAYLYDNENLDISIFYSQLAKIKDIYYKASTEGKIKGEDKVRFARYYKTIYFFIIGEIIDRAYSDKDTNVMSTYEYEVRSLKNDPFISPYLNMAILDTWLLNLTTLQQRLDVYTKVLALEKDIDYCNTSCSVSRYNSLVNEYNGLLSELKSSTNAVQDLFETTMRLIDISVLFPTQDHMDLVNTK